MEWIPCKDEFIEGDVIRWREGVWEKRGRKQSRSVHLGDRLMTGEVIHDDGKSGLVTLLVRASTVMSDKSGRGKVQPLKTGGTIRRKRATLIKGGCERLFWSEESVRAQLMGERKGDGPAPDA